MELYLAQNSKIMISAFGVLGQFHNSSECGNLVHELVHLGMPQQYVCLFYLSSIIMTPLSYDKGPSNPPWATKTLTFRRFGKGSEWGDVNEI